MAKVGVLGLYSDANYAAEAGDGLQRIGLSNEDYDFLTGAPYPEGAFGERESSHRLYVFPFVGALCGLTAGILLTSMTQMAYPLVTGGKPILSLPPMAIVPTKAPCWERSCLRCWASSSNPGFPDHPWVCTMTVSPRVMLGCW